MTVTPDDSARLQRIGIVLLKNLASLSTVTLLYGIFIMVFSIALHTTLRRGLKSRPTLAIFILIILSFAGGTMYWATWMAGVAILTRWVFVKNVGMALSEKMALANAAATKSILVQTSLIPLLRFINDTVVVWRAWVLFPEHQWAMIIPAFFLFATFALTLTEVVFSATGKSLIGSLPAIINNQCDIAVSMATNLLATLLIAYKLWEHRKTNRNLGLTNRNSPVQKVLFLLVESGVIFFGLQLASLLLGLLTPGSATSDTASSYVTDICHAIYVELTAMYPALVVIIVNKQRSVVHVFGISTVHGNGNGHANAAEHRPATIGNLVFADPPTKSIVDSEKSLPPIHSMAISPTSTGSTDTCMA